MTHILLSKASRFPVKLETRPSGWSIHVSWECGVPMTPMLSHKRSRCPKSKMLRPAKT